MVAGMRMRVKIHNIAQGADDEIGGAMYTGTPQDHGVPAMIQYHNPNRLLLEQGVEVEQIVTILIQPGSLNVSENDEIEIVGPRGHEDIGNLYGVNSVQRTGFSPNDSRGRWLVLSCKHIGKNRDTRVGFQ